MKLLERLIRAVKGFDKEFPLRIVKYWYTGSWYMYRGKLHDKGLEFRSDHVVFPVDDQFMFNPFKCGVCSKDESRLVLGLIPAFKHGDKVGLYRVDRVYGCNSGSDRCSWDDGMYADFSLVRVISVSKMEELKKKETK